MTPEQRESILKILETTALEPVTGQGKLGWVYFIICLDQTARCKIGFTTGSAESRLANLQTGCPSELALFVIQPGTLDTERAIHERFASSRIRGEWFEMTDELRAYMVRVIWVMSEIVLSKGRKLEHWMSVGISTSLDHLHTMPESLEKLLLESEPV